MQKHIFQEKRPSLTKTLAGTVWMFLDVILYNEGFWMAKEALYLLYLMLKVLFIEVLSKYIETKIWINYHR